MVAYAGYYDNSTDTWQLELLEVLEILIGKGYQMGTVSGGTQILAFTGTIS